MKTKTWIILFAVLLLVCIALSIPLLMSGDAATYAEIISEGKLLHTLDLRKNQSVMIYSGSGYNKVTVRDGKIAVTEADCPDHYCMHRGYCNGGTEIVCLPNRLVIRFLGGETVDAAVG